MGGAGRPPLRRLFAIRDYRMLWLGALCMIIAQQMRFLAIAQWLLDETGKFEQLGILGAVQLPVQVVAVLWGGALADRFDRRWLMAGTNVLACAALIAVASADSAGVLEVRHAYLTVAVLAAMQVLVAPSRATITPRVVPRHYLSAAVTVDTGTQNGGWILGGALFGLVAWLGDVTMALWMAAGFAAISAVAPLGIRTAAKSAVETSPGLSSVLAGARYIGRHPILPGLFLLDWGITVVSYYREILPVLATGLFMAGASAAGALSTANAAGSVVGTLIALLFVNYRAKGIMVLAASGVYACLLFAMGSAPWLWLGLIVIGGLGAADAVTVAVRQATVQLTTPDEMRGRAFSFMVLAAQTANNVGLLWVGFWAGSIGAPNTMLLGGALGLGATVLIGLIWRQIRAYRAPSAGDAGSGWVSEKEGDA